MNIANQLLELDALDVLVVVDNETDTLSSVADGIPQIPEAMQLVSDLANAGPETPVVVRNAARAVLEMRAPPSRHP